jgi:hypothetical protein
VLRIVSSPPPSAVKRLPTRSARGIDGDAMSGDRIENGHE